MISLYNTLSKQKEIFEPLEKGKVGMYTCGLTVYDFAQIGNWRSYVFADTLRRMLEASGFEVRKIQNFTDVGHLTLDDIAQGDSGEDKMLKRAAREHKTPEEIAEFYTDAFLADEQVINNLPSHFTPRATAHIVQMITMIERLIEKGHAYESNGAVFYDVTSFPEYGKLSGNTLDKLKVGARLEEHPDKRHPWDFALWLPAPTGHLMRWQSPWSEGYPGWHIECSAMSQEYLGDVFDIHTGGEDNIFPHHEAEIAQTCGVTDRPIMAKVFLHTRHMLIDGTKMSKSKGNFYTLSDIVEKGFDAMDLRLLYLQSHYRSQMNFTWESLEQAKKNKQTLFEVYAQVGADMSKPNFTTPDPKSKEILALLQDDLATPLALAKALAFAKEDLISIQATKTATEAQKTLWQNIFFLFGLRYTKPQTLIIPEHIQTLMTERDQARQNKDFARSDQLRDEIQSQGFLVKDTADGTKIS